MSTYFKTEATKEKFTDQLLNVLRDTYYTWTEEKDNGWGSAHKCAQLRGGRAVPEKAEEVFIAQSVSHCIAELKYEGWKNVSNHHDFLAAAEECGFTVRHFWGVTVITV